MAATTDEVVALLLDARRQHRPVPAPELADAASAYAVQEALATAFGWFHAAVPACWKSGGPSRETPLSHSPLPPHGVWSSPADARDWPAAEDDGAWPLSLRGIEAEIALRLGQDVDAALAATLDVAGAESLVDAMCASIEIVESRWREGLRAPELARLADLQSHGALVLGEWQPYAARDWAQQRCMVKIGAAAEARFRGGHVFDEPAFVLPQWLRHLTRHGATVAAGTVVSTGTWCGLLHAKAGDAVLVTFDGIGSARVQL